MKFKKEDLMNIIRDRRFLIITMLIVVVVLLLVGPMGKATISFEIEDKCGLFMNLFSHTLEDEQACKMRCALSCESEDGKFHSIDFEEEGAGHGCNKCVCFCR